MGGGGGCNNGDALSRKSEIAEHVLAVKQLIVCSFLPPSEQIQGTQLEATATQLVVRVESFIYFFFFGVVAAPPAMRSV